MKFCSFERAGERSFGLVRQDGTIVDLKPLLGPDGPRSLDELIPRLGSGELTLAALAARAKDAPGIEPASVTWRPPVTRPGKILGVAINNRIGQDLAFRPFSNPAFFMKPVTSLVGHGQPVVVREDYGLTHPEPELAVIIGKGGRNIPESESLAHVFGYSIINDVTSPGLKERDSLEVISPAGAGGGYRDLLSWRRVRDDEHARSVYLTYHALSKGTDTFGPMGPWIVTADEIADPNRLAINSYDGDDLVFEDSTANLVFPVERVIAHASNYMTLEAGDVLHCGTAMKPREGGKYRALTQWDMRHVKQPMVIEIEGVGRLENPVAHQP